MPIITPKGTPCEETTPLCCFDESESEFALEGLRAGEGYGLITPPLVGLAPLESFGGTEGYIVSIATTLREGEVLERMISGELVEVEVEVEVGLPVVG